MLLNLLGNAVKFTERGEVRLQVASDGDDRLRFTVTDTGIGMAAADQARLFEPFAQADASTTRRFGGTGLGLTICRDLVALLGGELSLTSAAGAGSAFSFSLPLPAVVMGLPAQRTHLEGGPALHGLRLLLAEDNAVNRQVAVGLLTREGCAVDVAEDGQQALDALAARPGAYDALLLDCQMPLLDGYDTARAVRRREREAGTPRLPIVALTASAMASDRERCLDAGMDDYLSKPFSSAALSAALSRLLAGSRTTVAPVLDPAPLAELREALGEGAGSFVVELVRVVAGQVAEHLPRLRGDDVEARRTSAHALRGSSLTLGACRVAQLCADAEEDPAAVSGPLCDALAREVEAARAALLAGAVAV